MQNGSYSQASLIFQELVHKFEVSHIGFPSFIVLLQNLALCLFESSPRSESDQILVKEKVQVLLKQVIQNIEALQSDYPEVIRSSALLNLFSFYFTVISTKMIEFARDKASIHPWLQSLEHDQKAFLLCLRGIAQFFTGTKNYSQCRLFVKKALCQAESPNVIGVMAHNLAVLNYFQIAFQNEINQKKRRKSKESEQLLTQAVNEQIKQKAEKERGQNPHALFKNVKGKSRHNNQDVNQDEFVSDLRSRQIPVDDIRREIREVPHELEKQKINQKIDQITGQLAIPNRPQFSRKLKRLASPLMRQIMKSPYYRYQEAKRRGFRESPLKFKQKLQKMRRKTHLGKLKDLNKRSLDFQPSELNQVLMEDSEYGQIEKEIDALSYKCIEVLPAEYSEEMSGCSDQQAITLKQRKGLFKDLERELNYVTGLLLYSITHFEFEAFNPSQQDRLATLSSFDSLSDFIKLDPNQQLIQNPNSLRTLNFIAQHYLDQDNQDLEVRSLIIKQVSAFWVNYAVKLAEAGRVDEFDKKKAKCLQAALLVDQGRVDEAQTILESLREARFHHFRQKNLEILCESLLSLILRNSTIPSEQAEGIVMIEKQKAKRKKITEMHEKMKKLIIPEWTEFMDEREDFILHCEKYL